MTDQQLGAPSPDDIGPRPRAEDVPPAPAVKPRRIQLPLGGSADFFTREQLTILYHCSHGELGRLIARRMAPLPVRIEGMILWYVDETLNMQAQVTRTLERWRR